ncbi:MAG: hypothetical protein WHT47_02710 [Hydrogenothermaceae bacterium]
MDIYISLLGITLVIFSIFSLYKNYSFIRVLVLYVLANSPVFFIINEKMYYGLSFFTTVGLYLVIVEFIKKTYKTDVFLGIEGLVLSSPKLSIFVRVVLLMMANFPPSLNFSVVFNYLLNSGLSINTIYILALLMFNFMIFSVMTNRLLFGKPNKNLIYKEPDVRYIILMSFLSLTNLVLGILYLLSL